MSAGESFVLRARELLTMAPAAAPGAAGDEALVGCVHDGAVWAEGGTIRWVGPFAALPEPARGVPLREAEIALPAFVECHTHALFAGSRHDEFAVRNRGGTYAEILEAGGGILSTVAATRAASDEALATSLRARLDAFAAAGCAVVEVKTGYGLAHDEELRHLRIIREVAACAPVEVVATYLGAHAIPAERRADREGYVAEVCERTLPAVAREGLATAADVFCDRGAFTAEESRRILGCARELGLAARIHTDELSASGGCGVAADVGAKSADHLDHAGRADLERLAESGTAAVLLPGVTVFLDMPRRPDVAAMRELGVPMAVSTDYNPGSSHTQHLLLMATLACTLLKLTPGEVLAGLTRVPAEILGLGERFGRLAAGAAARLVTVRLPTWRALPYHMAPLSLMERVG